MHEQQNQAPPFLPIGSESRRTTYEGVSIRSRLGLPVAGFRTRRPTGVIPCLRQGTRLRCRETPTTTQVGCAAAHAALSLCSLMSVEGIGGEKDGTIKCIRQATVTTTDLHSNDHQLGDHIELPREGGVHICVSKRQTHSAVCRDDLK
jgi:hypothetical protein